MKPMSAQKKQNAYEQLKAKFDADEPVILDGGMGTELERTSIRDYRLSDSALWGTWALYHAPHAVLDVHQRYVAAGCDVISTNTWSIITAPEREEQGKHGQSGLSHWMDVARLGIRLARQAIDEAGKTGECLVAFSVNGDVDSPQRHGTLQLLSRVFEHDPPDLILMETLSLIRDNLTFPAVEMMLGTGLPVWLSFRRCRHGVCGVHGQHWGGPEGDLFGRAASSFEEMGVGALMINCLPVEHVPGMLPWLRDFTDMPLGVYPNLGRYLDPGWQSDERIGRDEYAELAHMWRVEGAQIVGGCCGVTPEHIAAVSASLQGTKPGRPPVHDFGSHLPIDPTDQASHLTQHSQPWVDQAGRSLYPLDFPETVCDPGIFQPTQGSFLIWKFLFQNEIGKDQRCLDVGCGTGVLAVQLARNGAKHVDAFDIQKGAVANTMTNAFRNGVAERVKGSVVDLYTFQPEERYDIVVASLYQMPVDPLGEISGHRAVDYWGRNLLDHLIGLLPELIADDGVAYLMQISILSRLRTSELMNEAGLECRVVDFSFFNFTEVFRENLEQIHRVEELSDAYHLGFRDDDMMVMYLIEVKKKNNG